MDILTSVHLGKRLHSQTCMLHFSAKHHTRPPTSDHDPRPSPSHHHRPPRYPLLAAGGSLDRALTHCGPRWHRPTRRKAGRKAFGTKSAFKALPGVGARAHVHCRNTVEATRQNRTSLTRHIFHCKSAPLVVKHMAWGDRVAAADLSQTAPKTSSILLSWTLSDSGVNETTVGFLKKKSIKQAIRFDGCFDLMCVKFKKGEKASCSAVPSLVKSVSQVLRPLAGVRRGLPRLLRSDSIIAAFKIFRRTRKYLFSSLLVFIE